MHFSVLFIIIIICETVIYPTITEKSFQFENKITFYPDLVIMKSDGNSVLYKICLVSYSLTCSHRL